nr:N-acetylglucosamine-6-phosphate deacetylase [Maliponia aquimaris]
MSMAVLTFRNGPIFDGTRLRAGHAARYEDGQLVALLPEGDCAKGGAEVDLQGDILSPGYVDLQVNGGGGVLLNDAPSLDTLRRIAEAHHGLGVSALLPTLITDTPDITHAAISAAIAAVQAGVPGIAGLHLEGPHLSVARKGAHDPALIRPMETEDLRALLEAARQLPILKVTIAPENVTEAQVSALAKAGVLVSLGHSDAGYDTCRRYFAAGARCATHLFNAMSQLGNREPGLVGAVLASGHVSCGLIADAVHVHPETMRAAWAAKRGPGRIYLVSDAMAVAGTDLTGFTLGGRRITRRDGVLTLQDGTLAGADLDLTTALRVLVQQVGVELEQALQAAVSVPAAVIGLTSDLGTLTDAIRISPDLSAVRRADPR